MEIVSNEDLAPDANEPGDDLPDELSDLTTDSENIVPDENDLLPTDTKDEL